MATSLRNNSFENEAGISIDFENNSKDLSEKEDGVRQRKTPRRVLHFSDGVLEEFSSSDDDDVDETDGSKKNKQTAIVDTRSMPWIPFLMHVVFQMGTRTIQVCDYLGENLAYFFGITSPKFEYEIEEFKKMEEEEEERQKKHGEDNAGWMGGDEGGATITTTPGGGVAGSSGGVNIDNGATGDSVNVAWKRY